MCVYRVHPLFLFSHKVEETHFWPTYIHICFICIYLSFYCVVYFLSSCDRVSLLLSSVRFSSVRVVSVYELVGGCSHQHLVLCVTIILGFIINVNTHKHPLPTISTIMWTTVRSNLLIYFNSQLINTKETNSPAASWTNRHFHYCGLIGIQQCDKINYCRYNRYCTDKYIFRNFQKSQISDSKLICDLRRIKNFPARKTEISISRKKYIKKLFSYNLL